MRSMSRKMSNNTPDVCLYNCTQRGRHSVAIEMAEAMEIDILTKEIDNILSTENMQVDPPAVPTEPKPKKPKMKSFRPHYGPGGSVVYPPPGYSYMAPPPFVPQWTPSPTIPAMVVNSSPAPGSSQKTRTGKRTKNRKTDKVDEAVKLFKLDKKEVQTGTLIGQYEGYLWIKTSKGECKFVPPEMIKHQTPDVNKVLTTPQDITFIRQGPFIRQVELHSSFNR